MTLKKWFKKLKYWQKGAVVAIIFGLFSLSLTIGSGIGGDGLEWEDFVLEFVGDFMDKFSIEGEPSWAILLGFSLYFLTYGIIGALIGLIIGKIKKKK